MYVCMYVVLKLSSDSGESPNLIFKAETNCAVDL